MQCVLAFTVAFVRLDSVGDSVDCALVMKLTENAREKPTQSKHLGFREVAFGSHLRQLVLQLADDGGQCLERAYGAEHGR